MKSLIRKWSGPSGTTAQTATQVVGPFGDNPSDRFAASSPFRGAICAVGYNIRCRKTMPPLKGEGDRRQAVERCAPGASVVHCSC